MKARPNGFHRQVALLGLLAVASWLGAAGAEAAARAPAFGTRGMVVTSQAGASWAGLEMLERGGNAVDAAVAAAFAVSVTQPFSTGLGGGAFVLLRLAPTEPGGEARVLALDARETAPAAATRDMYVEEGVPERASVHGPLAVGTPGLVAGLVWLQETHGTLPLAQVMQPAIRLAEEGFEINAYAARMMEAMRRRLPAERFPETFRIQFPPDGQEALPGWRLVQKDLGGTLRAIAKDGRAGFYEGRVAEAIAKHVQSLGGLITRADLEGYEARQREAVRGRYRGLEVLSFPPPSSGGVALIEMLNILEGYDVAALGAGSSAGTHLVAEAMKLAFADRAAHLGDPDFVEVPTGRLVSKAYAERLRARIGEKAATIEGPGLPVDDAGTTHLSVVDSAGNAVAITKTINTPYGSGITVPGTGVILNNEMNDFSVAPDTPNVYGLIDTTGANAVAPGKRPLSSMTPTILVQDGRVRMVTGSPGGPRIITTTLHTILNVVDHGMDVQAAVSAPRFHHQWVPDRLWLEPEFPIDVVQALEARGHQVELSSRHWSAAEAIVIDPESGRMYGGSDPRRGGLALGLVD